MSKVFNLEKGNSMNIQNRNIFKRMTRSFALLIAIFSMVVFGADRNGAKDRELIIVVDATNHCAVNVVPSNNESNCALLFAVDKNPCKNDPECVCSKKEKYITWQTSNGDEFDIHFTNGSPFKQCAYSAERDGKVRCKIKNQGDYYYEVNVEGCAKNPYDPRIVVQ